MARDPVNLFMLCDLPDVALSWDDVGRYIDHPVCTYSHVQVHGVCVSWVELLWNITLLKQDARCDKSRYCQQENGTLNSN